LPSSGTFENLETVPIPVPPSPAGQSPWDPNSQSGVSLSLFERILLLFVLILGFLLASFPARNSDLWGQLAAGRLLSQGQNYLDSDVSFDPNFRLNNTWLYDLFSYGLYSAFGGPGLVFFKAAFVVGAALIMLRLSVSNRGWLVPAFCTALALLALSTRLLLQPATVSYLFLALTFWFLRTRWEGQGMKDGSQRIKDHGERQGDEGGGTDEARGAGVPHFALRPSSFVLSLLPHWPLVILFILWANMDSWFVLGLATVALVWLGRVLDFAWQGEERGAVKETRGQGDQETRRHGTGSLVSLSLGLLVSLFILGAVCLFNPFFILHPSSFIHHLLPPELGWFGLAGSSSPGLALGQVTSPFQRGYFTYFGQSPAAWAYFPLVGLGLLSFALNRSRWSWQRFLPWLGLFLLSAFQVRAVPFFAIIAGPVLAKNLQEFFSSFFDRERLHILGWQRGIAMGRGLIVAMLLVLPILAWPGWLQGPPYEPRRWAIDLPPSLEAGALATKRWHDEGKLGPQARGLHLSAETANVFAWFCPEDKGVLADPLLGTIKADTGARAEVAERLRSAGINHLILYDPDPVRLFSGLDSLLNDPEQWPLLYVEGNLAVFGWRDPALGESGDTFRAWQLDLNRLAFHPAADKKAPRQAPDQEPEPREWWEAFWKPASPRPIDRDEARLHLLHAEASRGLVLNKNVDQWVGSQGAALLGAVAGWPGSPWHMDAFLRISLLPPLMPSAENKSDSAPVIDRLRRRVQGNYAIQLDDVPPALLYLAVRSARRAVAANPLDAQAYAVLGESYLRFLDSTRESVWGKRLSELAQIRRVQASAALNQAISLNPTLARAHHELAGLYREMNCLDLSLKHGQAHYKLTQKAGPPPGVSAEDFRESRKQYEEAVNGMASEMAARENKYTLESAGLSVLERAMMAAQMGLAGKARDILLESDISAFGPQGMELELDLLLRTGQPRKVEEWTGPEHLATLGQTRYHWLHAQALAAIGNYALAEEECAQLAYAAAGGEEAGPVPLRDRMALLVGQAILNDQVGAGSMLHLLWRRYGRLQFHSRIMGLSTSLKQQADAHVLRGLLALEEGEVDEADAAFRLALTLWQDDAADSGLDFNGRIAAQTCVEWLK